MNIRRQRVAWISASVLAAAIAGAALVQASGAPSTTAGTAPVGASATPAPSLSPAPARGPSSTPHPTGPATPGAEPPSGTPTTGSSPAPADAAPGDEAPGDELTATGPSTLPPSKPLPDPVSLPFPASASAVGKLVEGFPTRVVPQAPHSTITNSSVAAEGSRLQVTLSAESTLAVVDVLDFYRTELAKIGMLDAPAPALSGSSALVFARGDHTVTLSATTVKGGCRYAILGSFTAPS